MEPLMYFPTQKKLDLEFRYLLFPEDSVTVSPTWAVI